MSGDKFIQAPDGAIAGDEAWFIAGDQATGEPTNPFLHSCCDCGLVHRVEYALGTINIGTLHEEKKNYVGGELVPLPEGHLLALRFSRANAETKERREAKQEKDPEIEEIREILKSEVPNNGMVSTYYGCDVRKFDKEMLVLLVSMCAAQREQQTFFPGPRLQTASATKCKLGAAIMSPAAVALSRELKEGVTEKEVNLTKFGDVPIQDLDRDALLRIITLLAAGKRVEEPSRIILPGR